MENFSQIVAPTGLNIIIFSIIFSYYVCTLNNMDSLFSSPNRLEAPTIDIKQHVDDELTLEEQQIVINALPNHHKWKVPLKPGGKGGAKTVFRQRFSNYNRRRPGSLRNKIMEAVDNDKNINEILHDIVSNMYYYPKIIRYPEKRRLKSNLKPTAKRKRKSDSDLVSDDEYVS